MAEIPKMDAALREVFRVAYIYRQKYQRPTGEPGYWQAAADEMCRIVAELGEHPFAQSILLSCYEDIEREYKENRRSTG